LFWRQPPTTVEEAEELLAEADDIDWLAEAEWTRVKAANDAVGRWTTQGTDAGTGRRFHAGAVSRDPFLFILTNGDERTAELFTDAVVDELIERVPADALDARSGWHRPGHSGLDI
jgi:hypothetical protein